MKNWISMQDCVHGGLYMLASRNLCIGVYSSEQQGFVGVRTEFSDKFLSTEYHWDCVCWPFGTAKPILMLDMCPYDSVCEGTWREGHWVDNTTLMIWLEARLMEEADEGIPSTICAWCKEWIHRVEWTHRVDDGHKKDVRNISHGCCEVCHDSVLEKLE